MWKLSGKFHFFLRFCTRKRSKTYIYYPFSTYRCLYKYARSQIVSSLNQFMNNEQFPFYESKTYYKSPAFCCQILRFAQCCIFNAAFNTPSLPFISYWSFLAHTTNVWQSKDPTNVSYVRSQSNIKWPHPTFDKLYRKNHHIPLLPQA